MTVRTLLAAAASAAALIPGESAALSCILPSIHESELIVVGHGENSVFAIHNELRRLQERGYLNF